jgi:hypothetical protein
MPFCTPEDMKTVAAMVKSTYTAAPPLSLQFDLEKEAQHVDEEPPQNTTVPKSPRPHTSQKETMAAPAAPSYPKDVIPFDLHRRKQKLGRKATFDVSALTLEQIQQQYHKRQQQDAHLTQAELARHIGLSPGYLGKLLRGQRPLNNKNKLKFYKALFVNERLEIPVNQRS